MNTERAAEIAERVEHVLIGFRDIEQFAVIADELREYVQFDIVLKANPNEYGRWAMAFEFVETMPDDLLRGFIYDLIADAIERGDHD